MTESKDYLNTYLVLKQPMTKEAALTLGQVGSILETGAYLLPGVGGVLSGRDAIRNVGGMAKNLFKGNWRGVGTQGLSFLGNSLMALADFIPGGSVARGAIRAGKVGGRVAKGLHAAKLADKLADINRSAKGLKRTRKAFTTLGHPINVAEKSIHRGAQAAMRRIAPGVGELAGNVARKTGLNTYGKMQMAGIAPMLTGNILEANGWAEPRQVPVPPAGRWMIPPEMYRKGKWPMNTQDTRNYWN